MRVAVIGGGFVGVTTAVTLVEAGHDLVLVERDATRRDALRDARTPFHEPGLDDALRAAASSGRLAVAARAAEVAAPDVAFFCVGTPARADGSADLSQLAAALEEASLWVGPARTAFVIKSTVPPGTTRRVALPILQKHGVEGIDFGLAMNPEFLREGAALADARAPDRVVVGALDALARERLAALYAGARAPYLATTPETAELVKYASNAMLAIRVAFSNEMANLSERIGVDVDEAMAAVGLDHRISPHFLKAGPGFGGSCFPKDLAALAHLARQEGVPARLVEAALAQNDEQPKRVVTALRAGIGPLAGKRVALLGLAFKPDTSDVRETRALPIWRALVAEGASVVCHDPVAGAEFVRLAGAPVELATDAAMALAGADAAILHTDWREYRALSPGTFAAMKRRFVLDTRRVLDRRALAAAGVACRAIGVPLEGPR